MKPSTHFRLLLLLSFVLFLTACQKNMPSEESTRIASHEEELSKNLFGVKHHVYFGPQVHVGDGKVRTFVATSRTGVPMALGIEMTEGALTGLSTSDHEDFILYFHKKAMEVTPFQHVFLNWNPRGHEPGMYEVPHFDMHFYMISNAERMAISPSSPLMDQLPPTAYRPAGFIPTPSGVPQMGKHWINPNSPEIRDGLPFTHTMIYGSYAGKLIFVEPMITQAFLQSGQSVSMSYGQPAAFQITGTYHPTTYNITKFGNKHYVFFSDFVWR